MSSVFLLTLGSFNAIYASKAALTDAAVSEEPPCAAVRTSCALFWINATMLLSV
jgi:hypothetical protein